MEKTERASRTGTRDGRAEGALRKPSVFRRAVAAVREFIVELLKELGRGVLNFLVSEFVTWYQLVNATMLNLCKRYSFGVM